MCAYIKKPQIMLYCSNIGNLTLPICLNYLDVLLQHLALLLWGCYFRGQQQQETHPFFSKNQKITPWSGLLCPDTLIMVTILLNYPSISQESLFYSLTPGLHFIQNYWIWQHMSSKIASLRGLTTLTHHPCSHHVRQYIIYVPWWHPVIIQSLLYHDTIMIVRIVSSCNT